MGETYPAGVVREGEERVKLEVGWEGGKAGKVVVGVVVRLMGRGVEGEGGGEVPEWVGALEKVGKKKNWVEGVGWKISVGVEYGG